MKYAIQTNLAHNLENCDHYAELSCNIVQVLLQLIYKIKSDVVSNRTLRWGLNISVALPNPTVNWTCDKHGSCLKLVSRNPTGLPQAAESGPGKHFYYILVIRLYNVKT